MIHARDAILDADRILTGGKNLCTLWRAFARRGLGSRAEHVPGSTFDEEGNKDERLNKDKRQHIKPLRDDLRACFHCHWKANAIACNVIVDVVALTNELHESIEQAPSSPQAPEVIPSTSKLASSF
ncbi:extracellular elastinolytic metalloproteinase [Ilyonectria robusta]